MATHNQTSLAACFVGNGDLTLACVQHWSESGQEIALVATDHQALRVWAKKQNVPCISMSKIKAETLQGHQFDYLFSIINLSYLAPEVVAQARQGAINYHDGPLPRYAGLHVSSWAVQNQETSYGISWHDISSDFDSGDIFVAQEVEIDGSDTAYTLSLKCHEAAIASFPRLVAQLTQGTVTRTKQDLSQRTVFLSTQRPEANGLIKWSQDGEAIDALVRSLNYQQEANPLALPKLLVADTAYLITRHELLATSSGSDAGVVSKIAAEGLDVATGTRDIRIAGLARWDGSAISISALVDLHNIEIGSNLTENDVIRTASSELNVKAGKSEKFWKQALEQAVYPNPFSHVALTESTPGQGLVCADAQIAKWVPSDTLIAQLSAQEKANVGSLILCLFGAHTALLQNAKQTTLFTDALEVEQGSAVGSIFTQLVPVNLSIDPTTKGVDLFSQATAQLEKSQSKVGYPKDLYQRYPSIELARPLAIFSKHEAKQNQDLEAYFHIVAANDSFAVYYNNDSSLERAATDHLASFETFALSVLQNANAPIAQARLINKQTTQLVQVTNNQTETALDSDRTILDEIAERCEQQPQAVALVYRDESITYAELDARTAALAAHLVTLGAQSNLAIGVCMDRSINMVVALLAVLRSGAAYLPLDPTYPASRIEHMISDSGIKILLHCGYTNTTAVNESITTLNVNQFDFEANSSSLEVRVKHADLAYMIYTSGSTGNPKGVMIEHGNLANFILAMDEVLDYQGNTGTWLAVTSMSFDISVLELLWTLARGFKVVVQEDNAEKSQSGQVLASNRPIDFGLFYFSSAAATTNKSQNQYRLLTEGAKFADTHEFSAIWTPERHFHEFGGLYPNPSVTSAAVATITDRIAIRAGSIVLPLHNPVRVAEEWSVVDNLSNGRIGFSFASGWHANDFVLQPDNYADRKSVMFEGIETIKSLWGGETKQLPNAEGNPFEVTLFPKPVQDQPPIWITTAGNKDSFVRAGEGGFNLLTNLLGQSIEELTEKVQAYRDAYAASGHEGRGNVSVMVHTFLGADTEQVKEVVRKPFCQYLLTSFDLVKIAPWAFPAFSQPSKQDSQDKSFDPQGLTDEDMEALVEHAFDRYFETAGLFGTPESCVHLVEQLKDIGVDEVASLIDFGVDEDLVLESLNYLDQLRTLTNPQASLTEAPADVEYSIDQQIERHQVTHFQCTPSMARLLTMDQSNLKALQSVDQLLLGGEALPKDLADTLLADASGRLINVYGPTETTIWSSSCLVASTQGAPSIGRPIANTQIYILNDSLQPVPPGYPGELWIAGLGVARGYWERPELTSERFLDNPFRPGERMYRTGDLASWSDDGTLQYLGRLDHQVKLNGYRIELGEIEALINQDAEVAQSVVIAQQGEDQSSALVAYLCAETDQAAGKLNSETTDVAVNQWHSIWDDTYADSVTSEQVNSDADLNTAGWKDSFTGEQHHESHMQEWVNETCQRVLALEPQRILEIGTGTGMLLNQLAPQCDRYVGVDFSATALTLIQKHLDSTGMTHVELVNGNADSFSLPSNERFDLILVNSVIQYFPSAEYLASVIKHLCAFLAEGGKIMFGDVRDARLAKLFHFDMSNTKLDANATVAQLAQATERSMASEGELLVSPSFLLEVCEQTPGLSGVVTQVKRGWQQNEMSRYRYDAVIHTAPADQAFASKPKTVCWGSEVANAADLEKLLRQTDIASNSCLVVRNIPNMRLRETVALQEQATTASATARLGELRSQATSDAKDSIDPECLYNLDIPYRKVIKWAQSGELGLMDAYFFPEGQTTPLFDVASDVTAAESKVLEPQLISNQETMLERVQSNLAAALPSFMVPRDFIVLDEIPYTPNGKIDRNALPKPQRRKRVESSEYVAPTQGIESTVSDIFRAMLNLDKLSTRDNFFDLGANSLLIVQANNRLRKELDRHIPLVMMYRYPTVMALSAALAEEPEAAKPVLESAVSRGQSRRAARSQRKQRVRRRS